MFSRRTDMTPVHPHRVDARLPVDRGEVGPGLAAGGREVAAIPDVAGVAAVLVLEKPPLSVSALVYGPGHAMTWIPTCRAMSRRRSMSRTPLKSSTPGLGQS